MEAFGLNPHAADNIYPSGHKLAYLSDEEKQAIAKIKIPGVPQAHPDKAPSTLNFRYMTEDVPYGLVPLSYFGDLVGVETRYPSVFLGFVALEYHSLLYFGTTTY
jgi:hypothetical protein